MQSHPDPDSRGVVYEVNLEADEAIAAPFDTWLRDHIADMLQLDGFRSAEIFDDPAAPPGRVRRIVQYRLRSQEALDDYLAIHAPRMRAQGVAKFGERFSAQRRVLPHREEFIRGAVSTENCLNCGEVLTGQHCSHCGQHAKVRVLSLWGLIREVIGDIFDVDSRVWRTLWPLAFRPGLLTQDYLRGRRARYTPPFRMYLVLSLAFFVLASFSDPGSDVAVELGDEGTNIQLRPGGEASDGTSAPPDAGPPQGGPAPSTGSAAVAPAATSAAASAESSTAPGQSKDAPAKPSPSLDAETRKLVDALVKRVPKQDQAEVRAELEQSLSQVSPEDQAAARKFMADPCSEENFRVDAGPVLKKYDPRLREACRKIVADQQSFGRALWENVPKMMFLFLPLIAVALAVLYVRSGRYYVEHLLFVVHYHAFFFLAGIVVLLLARLSKLAEGSSVGSVASAVENIIEASLIFYIPWYLLRAMRRVYEQSWWKTVPKYALLGLAYLLCLVFTGVGLLAYTALTL